MPGDPWEKLKAAVLYQAYADYVVYCKIATGKRKHCKNDFTRVDAVAQLKEIRDYIQQNDIDGRLTKALEAYLKKRRVTDALKM